MDQAVLSGGDPHVVAMVASLPATHEPGHMYTHRYTEAEAVAVAYCSVHSDLSRGISSRNPGSTGWGCWVSPAWPVADCRPDNTAIPHPGISLVDMLG